MMEFCGRGKPAGLFYLILLQFDSKGEMFKLNFIFWKPSLQAVAEENERKIIIHYKKDENSKLDWNLWLWEDGKEGKKYEFTKEDDFGLVGEYEF